MIGDADRGHLDHFVPVSLETVAGQFEIGCLDEDATILRANIEAGTDLISHAPAEDAADISILLCV